MTAYAQRKKRERELNIKNAETVFKRLCKTQKEHEMSIDVHVAFNCMKGEMRSLINRLRGYPKYGYHDEHYNTCEHCER